MPFSEQAFASMQKRMNDLERIQAVGDVADKNIERRLGSIETTLSRLMWLVIVAIGSAALRFGFYTAAIRYG